MIHTVYSNSYEVLRACLLHNVEALRVGPEKHPSTLFERAFERVPVIVPSVGIAEDVRRAVARQDAVCAGIDFMTLSTWMGFFSKEPLTNVVGNEAEWMIWRVLCEEGPESFREAPGHERLKHALQGKDEREIYALSRRIAALFVSYATYRLDWVFSWLGLHSDEMSAFEADENRQREAKRLREHPDLLWQRNLWRRLAENPTWQGKRFLEAFPSTLRQIESVPVSARGLVLEDGRRVAMPGALHVFVPFVVPPLMLPILKAYAASGRDIWFYLLNPSSEYWFDLVPRRLFARGGEAEHREVGHPILADNGRSTRANIDRLWRFTQPETAAAREERIEVGIRPIAEGRSSWGDFARRYLGRPQDLAVESAVELQSYYLEANDPRLLRRIQDSILLLDPTRVTHDAATGEALPELMSAEDGSVRFVSAPTPTRELEGLAEWLLSRFEASKGTDEELKPDDVLVVMPDVSAALPLIERVFGSLPEGRRIEWRATGTRTVEPDSPGETLLELGRLLTGRVRAEALMEWLALPLVSERYGLAVEDLGILSGWLKAAGFRFGLSDAHLEAIDAERYRSVRDMSLARAVERLTLGLFYPDRLRGSDVFDALPVRGTETEGFVSVVDRPDLLETLARAAEDLEAFRLRAVGEGEPSRWVEWMTQALGVFFPKESAGSFAPLRRTFMRLADEMTQAGVGSPTPVTLTFDLFLSALAGRVEAGATAGKPTNAVTFTNMTALRGLPYKVVAVVGLNDDCAFPGTTRREEFDLMGAAPRRGDRDARVDNRNAFLDLLSAARSHFYVSHVVGTGTDEKPASVVAEELLTWILGLEPDDQKRRLLEARLVKRLPLTAFSPAAFRPERDAGGPGWQSHDPEMLAALTHALRVRYAEPEPRFADAGLEALDPHFGTTLPLGLIRAWWAKPATTALSLLGVRMPRAEETAPLGLVAEQSGLPAWQRRTEAVTERLEDVPLSHLRARWMKDGRFGIEGVREWATEKELDEAEAIVERLKATTAAHTRLLTEDGRPEERELSVTLPSGTVVTHRQGDLWTDPQGRLTVLRHTASKATSESSNAFVKMLIEHVACRAAGWDVAGKVVCMADEDKKRKAKPGAQGFFCLPEIPQDAAVELLDALAAPVLRLRETAAAGADDAPFDEKTAGAFDALENGILWRGGDLVGETKRRSEVMGALRGLATAGERWEVRCNEFLKTLRAAEKPVGQTDGEDEVTGHA